MEGESELAGGWGVVEEPKEVTREETERQNDSVGQPSLAVLEITRTQTCHSPCPYFTAKCPFSPCVSLMNRAPLKVRGCLGHL